MALEVEFGFEIPDEDVPGAMSDEELRKKTVGDLIAYIEGRVAGGAQ